MKGFWNQKRWIFAGVLGLSLIIVFFVARTFSQESLSRKLTFSSQWILAFRKWLDISWWTKLTYRIDYSKYEETYKDATELESVKSTVQNIIIKNIDNRISKLWVSDYKSYIQKLDNETQILVEIGGIADLDQAKEIIGKTVELEFKLPNDAEDDTAARKELTNKLLQDITANPDKMEELTVNKVSDDIYYNSYEAAPLSQLPSFYRDNLALLSNLPLNEFSDVLDGVYTTTQTQDISGNIQDIDLDGFTFFRVLDRKTQERTNITISDVAEVATQKGLTYDDKFDIQSTDKGIASGTYKVIDGTLWYNNWEIFSNQEARKVRILAIAPESTVWKSLEEIAASETAFATQIADMKRQLSNNITAEITGLTELSNDWISTAELQQGIPSFDAESSEPVQSYKTDGDITYILVFSDIKTASEKQYAFFKITWVDASTFEDALKMQTLYTIQDVFVQGTLSRVTAQTPDGKILNGANFKYAGVSSSQIGQPVVILNFDDQWKEIFCHITENNIWKQMAIFIGWVAITAPTIQAKICDWSAQIDGQFTPASAKELANNLNDWALPAPLILMQEEKVSPTLWENAFIGAVIAFVVGLLLIWVYMTIVYGFKKWFISLLSLTCFSLVMLAIVKFIDYALSLSWIAAIILAIWMAVDTNVLIFERINEEKAEWKSDESAIKIAYDRSRNAIKDGQLSTGLIGLLLFMMWINMFKGFGAMLVVWVMLTLLINVPLIKELLLIFYRDDSKKK